MNIYLLTDGEDDDCGSFAIRRLLASTTRSPVGH